MFACIFVQVENDWNEIINDMDRIAGENKSVSLPGNKKASLLIYSRMSIAVALWLDG